MSCPEPSDAARSKMRDLAWRWFEEVWSRGNEAAIREILAPDCRIHGIAAEVLVGPESFLPFWRLGRLNYRGISVQIDDFVVDHDTVAAFVTAHSLHLHSFNRVELTGCATFRFEGGLCVETHQIFDYLSVLGRCGAVDDLDLHQALFPLSVES